MAILPVKVQPCSINREVLHMANTQTAPSSGANPEPKALPLDGFTRWNELKHIIPLSHESVRQRELKGRFPKRVQLGSARCVAWPMR